MDVGLVTKQEQTLDSRTDKVGTVVRAHCEEKREGIDWPGTLEGCGGVIVVVPEIVLFRAIRNKE